MIKKNNFIADLRSSSCSQSETFELHKLLIYFLKETQATDLTESWASSHVSRNQTKSVRRIF